MAPAAVDQHPIEVERDATVLEDEDRRLAVDPISVSFEGHATEGAIAEERALAGDWPSHKRASWISIALRVTSTLIVTFCHEHSPVIAASPRARPRRRDCGAVRSAC
jgi:hypothetical protein